MEGEAQVTDTSGTGDGSGGDGGSGGEGPDRAEVEAQARKIGWKPEDQWKGDKSGWIDAPEFLERSKTFMPYLQHERTRLQTDLATTNARLAAQEKELQETREALKSLTEFNEEMASERRERRKAEIGAELTAAREAGNEVRVAELTNELQTLVKPAEKKPPNKEGNGTAQPTIQPWVKSFIEANADFMRDPDKVALFNNEMLRRRQGGDVRVGEVEGTALLNEARDAVEAKLNGGTRRVSTSKTEESRTTSGDGGSSRKGGKGYADMPKEARDQCDKQEKKFVGKGEDGKRLPGKAYATQAEWRAHYAREYFSPSTRAIERATE